MSRVGDGVRARAELIKAALSAFSVRGFPGVSIADLAKELGIAKATVMHHFPSKELLYNAVLAQVAATLEPLLEKLDERDTADASTLAEIACDYLRWARRHPDCAALLSRELLDNAERAERAKQWHLARFTATIGRLIERGQAAGMLRAFDPALPVEMFLGFAQFHVSAAHTRPHLMGKIKAKAYERAAEQQLATAMIAGFGSPDR